MLLLVMQAELEQRGRPAPGRGVGGFGKARHRGVDMVAIGADDIDRRARQEAALGPRMARPHRLVIGVEQIGEGRVEHAILPGERAEDEGLEKPAGVRQMPFCRAGIGHRLDRLVLGRQIGGERLALAPHPFEPFERTLSLRILGRQLRGLIEQNRPPDFPGMRCRMIS